jgi:hypothetical protein
VLTGTTLPTICGIHYWEEALTRTGHDEAETWTEHEGEDIPDIAISDDGNIIAATSIVNTGEGQEFWVYFYDSDENSLGEFMLGIGDVILDMSGDGRTVAVGGSELQSVHVFRIPEEEPVVGAILPVNLTLIQFTEVLILLILMVYALSLRADKPSKI